MRSLTRGWLEIDLDAVRRNAVLLSARAPALLPMVKANAYGLGAVPVARALERLEPWGFGVATIEEGVSLRDAGIARRILLFTSVASEDLTAVRDARLTPALASAHAITEWLRRGGGLWHLAIDTGMSRAGIRWDEVDRLPRGLLEGSMEGAFTHLYSAALDDGTLEEQEARFVRALASLSARPAALHVENSAAISRRARSPWSFARPGIFLYGVGSGRTATVVPEPVVALRARIVELRVVHAGESVSYDATYRAADERVIATIPVGYADGYRRALGNRAHGLLRGRRAPIVGVVTMDMTMLDVTGLQAAVGDIITLIGEDGGERVSIEALAALADASAYELLTALDTRLPRVYRGGES